MLYKELFGATNALLLFLNTFIVTISIEQVCQGSFLLKFSCIYDIKFKKQVLKQQYGILCIHFFRYLMPWKFMEKNQGIGKEYFLHFRVVEEECTTLKQEAVRLFETLVSMFQSAQCHIQAHGNVHQHRCNTRISPTSYFTR